MSIEAGPAIDSMNADGGRRFGTTLSRPLRQAPAEHGTFPRNAPRGCTAVSGLGRARGRGQCLELPVSIEAADLKEELKWN